MASTRHAAMTLRPNMQPRWHRQHRARLSAPYKFGLFTYNMPKVVRVKNSKIGPIYRLLQALMLIYFIGFVIIWGKGHQRFDDAVSGSQTSVRGITRSKAKTTDGQGSSVLNTVEHTVEVNQADAFVVITRTSKTTLQSQGLCPEARDIEDAHCHSNEHCSPGGIAGQSMESPTGSLPPHWVIDVDADAHGVFTGRCVRRSHTCQVFGWCPIQEDLELIQDWYARASVHTPPNHTSEHKLNNRFNFLAEDIEMMVPMDDVVNLSIFVKTFAYFPYFNVSISNILYWMDETYLSTCSYSPGHPSDRYCPNFRIGDILALSGADKDRALRYGCEITITVDWNCDLIWPLSFCRPKYNFLHLDAGSDGPTETKGRDEGIALNLAMYNIPMGEHQNVKKRLMRRVSGIYFLVRVKGRAGKFNLFIFTMNFGANLALLSFATYLCDIWLFRFAKRRGYFFSNTHQSFRRILAKLDNLSK